MATFLLVGGYTGAQKKNVSKAQAKILSEVPDTKAAKEAILLALKDSTTDKLAKTWFVAGEVFYKIYDEQQKLQWMLKKGDQALMAQSLVSCLEYYTVADSLDKLPDAKGRIKPAYHNKIVEKVKGFQRGFTEAGSYYYDNKDYKSAITMFGIYLKYPSIPYMKGQGLEKDTLIPLIYYYCGLSATQAEDPATAVKFYEVIKDSMDYSKWIYARLCDDYMTLKDTVNMVRIFQSGAIKFPQEPNYIHNLINYYINESRMNEALIWIERAIEQEPNSAVLWNVKGQILEKDKKIEEAKACFQKAIDFDPNFAEALGNLGRIYYNNAVAELERINTIHDDNKYKIEKAKMKSLFELPRPYFEKAIAITPEERDYVVALRGIYYNLGMDAEYQQMDRRLKEMTKKTD